MEWLRSRLGLPTLALSHWLLVLAPSFNVDLYVNAFAETALGFPFDNVTFSWCEVNFFAMLIVAGMDEELAILVLLLHFVNGVVNLFRVIEFEIGS